ncbi:AraC family transcriptional regulator [Paenibacillus dokdonensis]|uniref:AraC family transcriptional regulator n=1 Tax=Paenibacillus dokdonensis TaxID=2567944 RepID=A0ABU6GS14_9BACL|nr:AraC family transcriptional regulator [Paenibacillus dokdonensis]MEC0242540.1 AraC family transcriptional regulator [Paenibacillus dokdonensis]
MKTSGYLSFLVPPFPYFIEGNITTYRKGEVHPDRFKLGYFDVIIVKKGILFLGEEDQQWEITENHALILEPDKHHFSIEACPEETSFYWFHFQTHNRWKAQLEPAFMTGNSSISKLHFHTENTTVHLPKFQRVAYPHELFRILDLLMASTLKPGKLALWETQQTFMQVIQSLELGQNQKDSSTQLAEQVEIYLRQNFSSLITNHDLSTHFHVHENYLARCMKATFNCTPLEYLLQYRLDQGRSLLIQTDASVQRITEDIGFSLVSYFSRCFKHKFGLSPQNYRKQYRKPSDHNKSQ